MFKFLSQTTNHFKSQPPYEFGNRRMHVKKKTILMLEQNRAEA